MNAAVTMPPNLFDRRVRATLCCAPVSHTDTRHRPTAIALIPARYNSTRLPGKPLIRIAGRPLILHVIERALAAPSVGRAIVATDDRRILEAVRKEGFEAVMTRADHVCGSDRLAEAARKALDETEDVIVNVQGDEPLISPQTIERAVRAVVDDPALLVATTSEAFERPADVLSADIVKVVVDESGYALYFSRSPIPYPRDAVYRHKTLAAALVEEPALVAGFRKHTGLYVYRRGFLLEYARWPASTLERAESLEQLRMLERGIKIRVVEASAPSIGVDTEEDLERVRAIIEASKGEKLEF